MSRPRRIDMYYQEGTQKLPSLLRRPSSDTKIWRFMSLSKFLDLLARKALFLGQLSKLRSGDPYEGSLGQDRLKYFQKIMSDDDFARQELHIAEGQEINQDLRASFDPARQAWQNDRSAERTYINCWHINEVESANLWSVYTNQGEGIAIQSTVGALCRSLGRSLPEFTIAPVRYVDYAQFRIGPSIEDAAFYRRLSFKSERELRVRHLLPFDKCIVEQFWNPPGGVYVDVDCTILIEKIYISPTLGDWFAETVETVARRMDIPSPVIKSSISQSRVL